MQKKCEENSNRHVSLSETGISPPNFRKESLQLIRETTRDLGWKYKLWIPVSILLASVFLLPPRLLQFFTENITRFAEVDGPTFLRQLILFGVFVAICLWIGIFMGGVLAEWLRLQISINLRSDALKSLLNTRLERVDTAERGDWMTRMTGDLSSCEDFLSHSIPHQVRNITILAGSAILFFIHSGWIAFIPVLAAVLLAWFNLFTQKRMAPVLNEAREIEGNIFQTIIESFEGLRTIRSFGGEESVQSNLGTQLVGLKKAGMKIIKIMSGLMGLNEVISQLVITLILALVAFRLSGNTLTVEDVLIYPFYINLFLSSANGLVSAAYDWNRFFIEGGRLASIIYDDSGKIDPEKSIKGVLGIDAIGGRNVEIRYGVEPPVVSGFNFSVRRRQLVVMMGPSGCGKSTLLEVASGLRSHSGGELYLSTSESETQPVSQIPRELCAFVEQQPYLFVGTIRDNIKLGQSNVFDVEIMNVLQAVGLNDTVAERGGLDSILSDRGRNWSVGQQYRLALCRALVSQRPFLMLDEPFAALDEESVSDVIRTINLVRNAGAGVLLVTHVLPESLEADQIIELTRPNPG